MKIQVIHTFNDTPNFQENYGKIVNIFKKFHPFEYAKNSYYNSLFNFKKHEELSVLIYDSDGFHSILKLNFVSHTVIY